MKYEIVKKSWSKRRKLDTEKEISNIKFLNFIKQHNHLCKMHVTYTDQSEETLMSRVIFNEVNQNWAIDGMQVAVRLNDE